jgi:hypothetical protein
MTQNETVFFTFSIHICTVTVLIIQKSEEGKGAPTLRLTLVCFQKVDLEYRIKMTRLRNTSTAE